MYFGNYDSKSSCLYILNVERKFIGTFLINVNDSNRNYIWVIAKIINIETGSQPPFPPECISQMRVYEYKLGFCAIVL
jgi:hypothetical protein